MNYKRLSFCILGGFLSALFCLMGSQTSFDPPLEINSSLISMDFANRILLGFTLGISRWNINYILHGAIIGLLVSFSASMTFILDDLYRFLMYTGAGVFYGVIIEVVMNKFLKLPVTS
ncbi:MAG: hypothetical protein OEZ34_05925 [Spirochaetia bacterium]|nr:hypothetical protein [Spirochaetia bacterium]